MKPEPSAWAGAYLHLPLPVEEMAEHFDRTASRAGSSALPVGAWHTLLCGLVDALGGRDIDHRRAHLGGEIGEPRLIDDRREATRGGRAAWLPDSAHGEPAAGENGGDQQGRGEQALTAVIYQVSNIFHGWILIYLAGRSDERLPVASTSLDRQWGFCCWRMLVVALTIGNARPRDRPHGDRRHGTHAHGTDPPARELSFATIL